MKTNRAHLTIFLMLIGTLLYTAIVYPHLPERIPIHWNIRGEIDGWAPKHMAFVFGPGLIAFGWLLFAILPALSPRQFSMESFRSTYNLIMVIMAGLMAFVGVVSTQAALTQGLDVSRLMISGMCFFFAAMGNLLTKVKRNFFMGFRTPWTLASETVWTLTHRMGGRLFFVGGILGGIGALVGVPFMACFALIMVIALWPCVYSYIAYKRLEDSGML